MIILRTSLRCLGTCCLLTTLSMGCAEEPRHTSGGQAGSGIQVLKDLGVDTDLGARLDPTGTAVPNDYNPTLRPVTQIAKRSELFVAGMVGGPSNALAPKGQSHVAQDWPDGATDFENSYLAGDDSWLRLKKTMASGDLDGDGLDEIMVAYLTAPTAAAETELAFKVVKRDGEGQYSSVAEGSLGRYATTDLTGYPASPDNYWWMNNFNAGCGDLDGNGKQETLIAFNGSIILLGDGSTGYRQLAHVAYAKQGYPEPVLKLLKLAVGDVNNDGRDEIVVAEGTLLSSDQNRGASKYHVYAGLELKELASDWITDTTGLVTLRAASCAVGDLDADGLNEVVFVGYPAQSQTYYTLILEPGWNPDTKRFEFSFRDDAVSFAGRSARHQTPLCAIADFDGDGKKEVLTHRYLYPNLSRGGGTFTEQPLVDIYENRLGSAWDSSLSVGDVDGDHKAEVSYVTDAFSELYTLGFDSGGTWVTKAHPDLRDNGSNLPYLTMGDYDGDSLTVRFEATELLFSDPHPIAALAANPYWSGIEMPGGTSLGATTGREVEKEKSLGFSVGVTFGYESEGLFNLWDVSVKASFESSFDWTATQATTIEESYSYRTNNEDQVVFTAIPYDVYYYRVIQAPNPKVVGDMLTVNLPRRPLTLPVERGFYNAHNGHAPDIDEKVLNHTVGNPLSYPSRTDAAALIAAGGGQGLISARTMSVGQGNGATSIELSKTESTGTGNSFDLEVGIEAEAGAGGFTVGTSASFHYGESYSVTTSEGATYGGEVGNIPTKDFSLDRSFDWGLFSFPAAIGKEKFIVVQYYTESHN